jgi:hypothetical protein
MNRNLVSNSHLALFAAAIFCCLFSSHPVVAQKLVDPAKVAPEYREAAEKRRAEQIRQRDCAGKADVEKIMPRDRTAFLNRCLETHAGN